VPASPRSPEAPHLDLPELDKSDDSGEVDVGSFELSMGEELSLDEDDHQVDVFQVDIQELSDAGSNEAALDLDIGAQVIDFLPEGPQDSDNDAPPATGEGELDTHLEEPLESDEPSSDVELGDDGLEALPDLVNEEGDGDAGPELERAYLPSAPEGAIPEGQRYEADWLLLGAPCTALAATGDGVLAAAEQLMRFGHERRSVPLPAASRPSSLAELPSGNVLLVTPRGLLELSPSGVASFTEAPEPTRGSGAEVIELLAAPAADAVFARLANGTLLRRRGATWERHETGGQVRSLTGSSGDVTLLVIAARPTLQLSRDGGSSFHERLLPEPAATVALGRAPLCCARALVVAVADAERGLAVSSDGGATFRMVTGAVNVTALTIGEDGPRLRVFAALYREGRDATELVAIDPESGAAERVAELSGEVDEDAEEVGRTLALLFHDANLWASGGYGLAKLAKSG
jgi:hypothetical protein